MDVIFINYENITPNVFAASWNRLPNHHLHLKSLDDILYSANIFVSHIDYVCHFFGGMKFVEPIRDRRKISQIKNLLRGEKQYRNLLLFVIGINSALRISDLLQLKISHFVDRSGKIRNRFSIREQKRGKRHEIIINNSVKESLVEYLSVTTK